MHETTATVKVYATGEGAEIRIGIHGTATFTTACLVPDCVADQLKAEIASGKRTDLRIEQDAPVIAGKAATKKSEKPAGSGDKE